MAVMERLALLITADGDGAVRELDKVGKAADRELGRAEDKTDKLGKTFTSVGTKMMAASAVIGAGLWAAASATSDLNEAVSQTEQVFGSASAKVQDFAEGASAIGQSETQALEAANTFGLFFEKAGLANDEIADMSITMTELASDMASFKNTTPEDAIIAIGAALRGESEPIRNYGVLLDDATLKQRAFDMGLVETTSGTLPPAIKMQAAYAEILEQTGTIAGDFIRTADGAANAQRIAAAEFENAKASLGEGFLPVLQETVKAGGAMASKFAELNEATGGFISKALAATTVIGGVGGAGLVTAGKMIEVVKALKAADAAGSAYAAAALKWMGPVAIAAAGITVAYAGWEMALKQGKDAANDAGVEIEAAMLKADPEKLRRMLTATNEQIGEMKDNLAGSSNWAFWDADARANWAEMGAVLEQNGTTQATLILQMEKLADATGNTEANVLGWLQTELEAGRIYDSSADAIVAYRTAVEEAGAAVDKVTTEELELASAYADSREAVDDLIDSIDEYFGTIDAGLDPLIGWEAATDGLRDTLAENGAGFNYVTGELDLSSAAVRENIEAVRASRDAAVELGQAVLDNDGTIEEATAKTMSYRDALWEQVRATTGSEAAADAYIEAVGLTPENVTTAFQTPGLQAALDNSNEFARELANLPHRKQVFFDVIAPAVSGFFGDTFGGRRAGGGQVDAGRTYLVGEQGPELVTMGNGGHVTNARDTAAMMGGPQVIQLVVDGKTLAEVAAPHLADERRGHYGSRRV